MIAKQLETKQALLDKLVKELRELDIKIQVYSDRDRLAMEVHQTRYMKLDLECLDLMTQIKELESVPLVSTGG